MKKKARKEIKNTTLRKQIILLLLIISFLPPFVICSLPFIGDKIAIIRAEKENIKIANTLLSENPVSPEDSIDFLAQLKKINTYTENRNFKEGKYSSQIIEKGLWKHRIRYIGTQIIIADSEKNTHIENKDFIIYKNKTLQDYDLCKEIYEEDADKVFDNYYFEPDFYPYIYVPNPGYEIKNAQNGKIASKLRRNFENLKEAIIYTAIPQFNKNSEICGILLVSYKLPLVTETSWFTLDNYIVMIMMTFPLFIISLCIYFFIYLKIFATTKKLSIETANIIDNNGNISNTDFTTNKVENEIGELSRSFSNVIQKLNERQKELETYASDVSHEFKNPLASIRISSDMLSQSEMNDEERNKQIKQIQEEIHHLETLLNEIRDVSKLENNNDTENYELIPIDEMIKNIINRMKIVKPEIEFLCKTTTPNIKIYANPTYIDRIIENLLDNATSFSDLVCTSTESSNNILRIKVEDSGIGVPDEEKEKIFNRFYSNRKNSDKKTHSGLGLHTVKTIVEKLGGTIHVERSPIFGGAMFVIDLPIRQTNIYQDTSPQNENSYESKKTLNDELIAAFIMGIHSSYGLQVNSYLDYIEYMKKNIGKKFHSYEHYKKAFTKFESGGIIINWNFSAFLTFWNLIYRKSPDNLLIYLIVFVCNKAQSTLPSVLCMFSFGLFADYLYYKRFKKTRSEAQALFPKNEKRQVTYLAEQGGVLKQLPIIAIIISIIFILVNGTWFGIKIYPLVLQKVMQAFSRIFN